MATNLRASSVSSVSSRCFSSRTRSRWSKMSASSFLLGMQDLVRKLFADLRREPCEKLRGELSLFVERDAEAETELGVVFEERVAPGRAATLGVLRPRSRRQVSAVNRGTPGRVGDDEPVAKSCESSFKYGVSPQPAHAPENSNKGCCTCCARMCSRLTRRRSSSGIERKKLQFSRSVSRSGGCGRMLIAFSRASDLLRAGQTSTQMPQPVQSSTATCSVYFSPFQSGNRASRDLNVVGAPSSTDGHRLCYESPRADRPSRTCCTGYRHPDPRPAPLPPSCAFPSARCRSGTIRRTGARSPADDRRGRRSLDQERRAQTAARRWPPVFGFLFCYQCGRAP